MRYRSHVYDSSRWEGFAFRADDVVISTPAKCGTTWMQQMIGQMLFGPDPELAVADVDLTTPMVGGKTLRAPLVIAAMTGVPLQYAVSVDFAGFTNIASGSYSAVGAGFLNEASGTDQSAVVARRCARDHQTRRQSR